MGKHELRDRVIGMFLGIAIGDALGMPFEKVFTPAELLAMPDEVFADYQDPPPGHKFHDGKLKAGETTDDTQLSLVVAESLIACGRIDMDDMARRHVEAMDDRVSGWGKGTLTAVERLKSGVSWRESGMPTSGNGVMMKISPLAAMFILQKQPFKNGLGPKPHVKAAALASRTTDGLFDLAQMTHKTRLGVEQGIMQFSLASLCFDWRNGNGFITEFFKRAIMLSLQVEARREHFDFDIDAEPDLSRRIINLMCEKHHLKDLAFLADYYGDKPFYVYNSLPLTYACFLKDHDSFQAVINAIRVGGDTDTNASIVGALLGAKNGTAVFPQTLVDGLKEKDKILDVAERFCDKFLPL
ncbi:hypothetical protein HGA34_00090 [Candidatus Falkowbacteria bacterium]|nr:hypothetical protein [Candidatus Falkowbacteria bacterium]